MCHFFLNHKRRCMSLNIVVGCRMMVSFFIFILLAFSTHRLDLKSIAVLFLDNDLEILRLIIFNHIKEKYTVEYEYSDRVVSLRDGVFVS